MEISFQIHRRVVEMKEGMEGMRDKMNSVHQMLQTVLERGVPPFRRYAKQDDALPTYFEPLQVELPVSLEALIVSGPETYLNYVIVGKRCRRRLGC